MNDRQLTDEEKMMIEAARRCIAEAKAKADALDREKARRARELRNIREAEETEEAIERWKESRYED